MESIHNRREVKFSDSEPPILVRYRDILLDHKSIVSLSKLIFHVSDIVRRPVFWPTAYATDHDMTHLSPKILRCLGIFRRAAHWHLVILFSYNRYDCLLHSVLLPPCVLGLSYSSGSRSYILCSLLIAEQLAPVPTSLPSPPGRPVQ